MKSKDRACPAEPGPPPAEVPPAAEKRSRSRVIRILIGYVVAVACLVWVFHDVDWRRFVQNMAAINWTWVPLAVALDTVSYLCQGVRWHLLLRPQGKISLLSTTEAVYSGVFLNVIFPLRVGELARGYIVSRWMTKPLAAIIPSMALERLIEGIWVAVAIGLATLFVPLPQDLLNAGKILGVIVLAGMALALYLILRKKKPEVPLASKPGRWPKTRRAVAGFFRRMDRELRAIGLSSNLLGAFLFTLLMYICEIVSFWLIMESCGIHRSVLAGAVVFLVVHLGTAIPNAPANVGTYQFFCVVGLSFFGVGKTTASEFSVVVFLLLTIPLWVLGGIAFAHSGLTLSGFRRRIPHLEAERKACRVQKPTGA
jgi:uncharacterized protein (TIRG00374 family)